MLVRTYKVYKSGVIDTVEDTAIPHGAASRSLGWLTKGDHIELMRGRLLLGTEIAGTGRVTGLHVGERADGVQVLFKTYARKILYYSEATGDWVENGSDFLPAAVVTNDDDISFASYDSLAGAQVWLNSPNGTLAKIMTANPGNISDQYDSALNYKGRINIYQNRMRLWGRNEDKTSPYLSYIDAQAYTTLTAEVLGSGDGATLTFSGTLAFKGGSDKRTCFGIVVTAPAESFTDNFSGVLTGSNGGTGTINYMTGAWTLVFTVAPAVGVNNITATYQYETSTATGIADFHYSSPTRTAGQGLAFRQDDGGSPLQTMLPYQETDYCIHRARTWQLNITQTDTGATNLPYRDHVGIPNWRAAVPTGDGIYYVDDVDESQPRLRRMTLDSQGTKVIPQPVTLNVDLTGYSFDKCAALEWGDYILFACRTADSPINNRLIAYNKLWKSIDYLPYFISCLAVYNGVLICGDSGSNNAYELFSGVDDDDSTIENYWEGALDDLQVKELKKTKRLWLEGDIGPDQSAEVWVAYDNSAYAVLGTVDGNGDYVDKGQVVDVGAVTIGRKIVGGGSDSGSLPAYHYRVAFRLDSDKFDRIKVKFVATEIGYFSVTQEQYVDIRGKGHKLPAKYQTIV